ncbi:hypothetical protein J2Y49_006299 [Azospirillum sp. BE72]|nr:hypothetical protein [Azospirillum sp. BE72]
MTTLPIECLPVWEVFDPSAGRILGYARGADVEEGIAAVAELTKFPNRMLDAELVPIERLDLVPARLPAAMARSNAAGS